MRKRCAMRQVKPELSMVTSAAGRSPLMSSTVSATRRKMRRAAGSTSSDAHHRKLGDSATRLSQTLRRHRLAADAGKAHLPFMRSFSACISRPPRRSPDGSPATI